MSRQKEPAFGFVDHDEGDEDALAADTFEEVVALAGGISVDFDAQGVFVDGIDWQKDAGFEQGCIHGRVHPCPEGRVCRSGGNVAEGTGICPERSGGEALRRHSGRHIGGSG